MVETTYLPKTAGVSFARSDKGRVFLSGAVTLCVVDGAEWKDDNVYEIGQSIQGRTATGGGSYDDFGSRLQTRTPDGL